MERKQIALIALIGLTLLGLGLLFTPTTADRSYITYRYAQNIAAGQGVVYNPGDPHLSDGVSPLYAVLLAPLPVLPVAANMLGIVFIAAGAAACAWVVAQGTDDWLIGWGAAGIYAVFPVIWFILGSEVALWIALCLLALALYLREAGIGAAAALGVATLLYPGSATLALTLAAATLITGRKVRPAPVGVYGVMCGIGLIWAGTAFGGPLIFLRPPAPTPDLLAATPLTGALAFTEALMGLSWLWAAVLLLAGVGALRLERDRWALLPLGWAVLHLTVLILLNRPVYPWSFAPVIPAVAMLAALGIGWLAERFAPTWAVVLCALLIAGAAGETYATIATTDLATADVPWIALLPQPPDPMDARVGGWLAENTPPQARIGVIGTGQLGTIAQRPLIDFRGSLQAPAADAYQREAGGWWINHYAPDYIALPEAALGSEVLFGYQPRNDAWFSATYAEVARIEPVEPDDSPVIVWQRVEAVRPFEPAIIGIQQYPNSARLMDMAADFSLSPLDAGAFGRLRLRWVIPGSIRQPAPVEIRIQGRGEDMATAALSGTTVNFDAWPTGESVTTYHTIQVAPGLSPGAYDVQISVGGEWRTVATGKIPFPEGEILGGVSGARADFGDVAISGYRLARTPDGVEVLIVWEATAIIRTDYQVVIQVRDESTGLVQFNQQFEPLDGAYPTSVWSEGERVPDRYLLTDLALPTGNYVVYVSLLNPDGDRLLTVDGRDAVFVGRLTGQP